MILAHTIKYNIQTVLNLHTTLGRPMGKACAVSVCHLIESLKAIENTYHRHSSLLADSLPHVIQYLTCQVLSIVTAAKVSALLISVAAAVFTDIVLMLVRGYWSKDFNFLFP